MMKTTKRLFVLRLLFTIVFLHNSSQVILAGKNNQGTSGIVQRMRKYPRRIILTKRYNPDAPKKTISEQEVFLKQTIAEGVKKRIGRIAAQYYTPMIDKEANKLRTK